MPPRKGPADKFSTVELAFRKALGATLYQEAAELLAATLPNVPIDTGELIESVYIADRTLRKSPGVELGFGSPHAIYQHERTDYHHDHGRAKFLEEPLNAAQGGWEQRVASKTRANVERGASIDGVARVAPTRPRRRK